MNEEPKFKVGEIVIFDGYEWRIDRITWDNVDWIYDLSGVEDDNRDDFEDGIIEHNLTT